MHAMRRRVRDISYIRNLRHSTLSSSLRASRKECVKCCDMVTSTVKCLYRFFFRLEDEEGKEVVVSVADEEVCILSPMLPYTS
jgi:hypothetical protein